MIEFFKSDKNDISQLKKLWLDCFDDTKEAVDLFFNENRSILRAFCAKDNDKIVAALYLLNAELNGYKAHYLCGASTKADYRSKGIMKKLIEYALETARQDGDKFSLLMPANESLYDYYARFGYSAECSVSKKLYSRDELLNFDGYGTKTEYDFEQLQRHYFKDNFLLWNNSFKNFVCEYYRIYGTNVICTKNCFAIFEEDGGCAEVFYAVCDNESELAKILLENSSAENFMIFSKAKDNSDKEIYGMIKSLDNNLEIPKDVFIGITLM